MLIGTPVEVLLRDAMKGQGRRTDLDESPNFDHNVTEVRKAIRGVTRSPGYAKSGRISSSE